MLDPGFTCAKCRKFYTDEFIGDEENCWCQKCCDEYDAEQDAYWRSLYEGEKQAGLIPDKDDQ